MADEKQMSAVRFFCKHPFSDSGSKKSKANHYNWADLVQQISYFDFGHTQQDKAIIKAVDRMVRKEYPNDENWNRSAGAPSFHEKILSTIRSGFARVGAT